MTNLQTHQDICRNFSALLSYPTAEAQSTANLCQKLLREHQPAAASQLQKFIELLASIEPTRLEELFTSTFDLQPICYPYVGYQLCGESQKRGMFLMKMQQLYHEHDFNLGSELPDHLGEMLRFIGTTDNQDCRHELINEGLLPALEKIIAGLNNADHPYHGVLTALHSFLAADSAEKGALS